MATSAQIRDFIARVAPVAQDVGSRYGINPGLIMAQAAIETGYGTAAPNNNWFGITGRGQTLATHEQGAGGLVPATRSFRTFPSLEASAEAYARIITRGFPDAAAAPTLGDSFAALEANPVHRYASDANYASKLASTVETLNGYGANIPDSLPPANVPSPPLPRPSPLAAGPNAGDSLAFNPVSAPTPSLDAGIYTPPAMSAYAGQGPDGTIYPPALPPGLSANASASGGVAPPAGASGSMSLGGIPTLPPTPPSISAMPGPAIPSIPGSDPFATSGWAGLMAQQSAPPPLPLPRPAGGALNSMDAAASSPFAELNALLGATPANPADGHTIPDPSGSAPYVPYSVNFPPANTILGGMSKQVPASALEGAAQGFSGAANVLQSLPTAGSTNYSSPAPMSYADSGWGDYSTPSISPTTPAATPSSSYSDSGWSDYAPPPAYVTPPVATTSAPTTKTELNPAYTSWVNSPGAAINGVEGVPTPTLDANGNVSLPSSYLGAGPASTPAPPKYITVKVPGATTYAPAPYARPPLAYSAFPATDPNSFGTQLGNWFGGTPLGHITSFLQGQNSYGGGGILDKITSALHPGGFASSPFASVLGTSLGISSPASILAQAMGMTPAQQANQSDGGLAAIKAGQAFYSGPGNILLPTTDINGNIRNTGGDSGGGSPYASNGSLSQMGH